MRAQPLVVDLADAHEAQSGQRLPCVPDYGKGISGLLTVRPFSLEEPLKTLFIDRNLAEAVLATWRVKKNIILQGPPGVGKSSSTSVVGHLLFRP